MTTLWKRPTDIDAINARIARGAGGVFGIRITAFGSDSLEAEMLVEAQHLQPFGLLHGGVSVVLAETLGSLATVLTLPEGRRAVGIEINANHLAPVLPGQTVTAECRPFHTGRRTQVWQTEIRRADGKLACVSRLTTAVLEEPGAA
jgi:1,4-dihydroxy-2-naphthoyl-CoA hydrolase